MKLLMWLKCILGRIFCWHEWVIDEDCWTGVSCRKCGAAFTHEAR